MPLTSVSDTRLVLSLPLLGNSGYCESVLMEPMVHGDLVATASIMDEKSPDMGRSGFALWLISFVATGGLTVFVLPSPEHWLSHLLMKS